DGHGDGGDRVRAPRPHGPGDRARAAREAVMSLEGYRAFLAARDGQPDAARHVLPEREALLARLAREPVRSKVAIDAAAYRRNVARRTPERGLDARLLWLLATARANQAERFGVGLGELYGRIPFDGDPLPLHVALQEHYHTRILADVVAM